MPNPWDVFNGLLPKQPLRVGTALTVHADATVELLLPTGDRTRVFTSGVAITTGEPYFYRNGRVEGAAPALPFIEVEIT